MLKNLSSAHPFHAKLLQSYLQKDKFGTNCSNAGRMLFSSSSSTDNNIMCFIESQHVQTFKSIYIPLKPTKVACNVYGATHGGFLWSVSDIASNAHLFLFIVNSGKFDTDGNYDIVNANIRYHNAVSLDQNIVCRSTLVSRNLSDGNVSAHFYVDLIPEKYTPLRYDEEKGEWKCLEDDGDEGINFVVPDSTCTRATFTKMFKK
jgi:acyl-coenzyme A thioesterase PaaI-like protein